MPGPDDLQIVNTPTAVRTADYTAGAGELVRTSATGGSLTVTLPAAPPPGTSVIVKQVNTAGSNTTTVACAGYDQLNYPGSGVTSFQLKLAGQGARLQYFSGAWIVTSDDLPLSQLDSRYPQVYSVRAYGAAGDGVADDTAAIDAARSALVAAGAGILWFPPGTYLTSGGHAVGGGFPGAMIIAGAGWGSQIKLKAGANKYIFDFGAGGLPQYTPGLVIRDLYLNCNAASQAGASGAVFARGAVWCKFDHLWVDQPYEAGIRFYADGTGAYGHHNRITDCLFSNGYTSAGLGLGIKFEQSDENSVTGCTFQDCGTGTYPSAQVYDTSGGLQSFTDCPFVTTRATSVTMVKTDSSPARTSFTGCKFDSSTTGHLLELNGDACTVQGCSFLNFGGGAGVNAAIHLSGSYTKILGNEFTAAGPNGRAVLEDPGGDFNVVVGNTLRGTYAGGGPIVTAGAHTVTGINQAATSTLPLAISGGGTAATTPAAAAANLNAVTRAGGGNETYAAVTATGATVTVDLGNGNVQKLTLQASPTLTLAGATAGLACSISLYIAQDGTGSRTITWPASVKWPGGVSPVLSAGANAVDLVVLETVDGGTTWYGSLSGSNFH